MDRKDIAGLVIFLVCVWGCGGLFYGIGVWAAKRKAPMFFWAGSEVDPKTVSDVPAYNRENGRMWKRYSLAFWMSGALEIAGIRFPWCGIAAASLIGLACTVGFLWLIGTFRRIRKQYRV